MFCVVAEYVGFESICSWRYRYTRLFLFADFSFFFFLVVLRINDVKVTMQKAFFII